MTSDLNDDPEPTAAGTSRGGWISATQIAGLASLGAGAIHAAAIGLHAEHRTLSQLFVAVAAAQLAVGVAVLVRGGRVAAASTALVNAAAVVGWVVTRTTGISWIEGLEAAESPQFTDTACAALGTLAVVAALMALWSGRTEPAGTRLGLPGAALGVVTVAAMMYGATHVHSHADGHDARAAGAAHGHPDNAPTNDAAHGHPDNAPTNDAAHGHPDDAPTNDAAHGHPDDAPTNDAAHGHPDNAPTNDAAHGHPDNAPTNGAAHGHPDNAPTNGAADGHADDAPASNAGPTAVWPRPWDPAQPIDFSGVPGVSAQQQRRAERLAARTLRVLPKKYSDVTALPALGYRSIGDASTGYEHYINIGYIVDDHFLDPNHPESLVYRAEGDERTLVSAMYIAEETPLDDPALVGYGGPLMQWHVHLNLCWALNEEGVPTVVALTDDHGGTCPAGTFNAGGENPMVHVWVTPHECGPFAALEGAGAGQVDPSAGGRVDQCAAGHGHGDPAHEDAGATRPYDPAQPIDLGGIAGVSAEQQAFAENLVATTVVRLPQWSDPAVAEAAGFHSIGDAATGHEHYIQWDWINDDVWLDPDAPESLVYEPQPDGSKKLVSAMYMLPDDMPLDEVPDWGGRLMQWHVHNDLCFTDDQVAPQVAGLRPPDGACQPPLVARPQAPMIHVWITPHPCGPFAALEGVGAGAIKPGEERWCDHAHGS